MSSAVLHRRGVIPRASEAAVLTGYAHRFSHEGLLPIEPAFANLEPQEGAVMHGVLHVLAAADLARLDRIEGAEYLHLDVRVSARAAGEVTARAYRNPHPVHGKVPSRRYLRTLIEGAREHGLPPDWIAALEAQPSRHWPLLSDAAQLFVGLAERARARGLRPERVRLARRGRAGRADPSRLS